MNLNLFEVWYIPTSPTSVYATIYPAMTEPDPVTNEDGTVVAHWILLTVPLTLEAANRVVNNSMNEDILGFIIESAAPYARRSDDSETFFNKLTNLPPSAY